MAKDKQISFEDGLERFREIVETLEVGTPTLAQTLELYEEAVALAARLNAELRNVETRVEKLAGTLGTPLADDDREDDVLLPDEEETEDDGESLF